MAKEIERKYFIPFGVDEKLNKGEGKKIKQAYIDYENDERIKQEIESTLGQEVDFKGIKEARVRQKGEGKKAKYFLTLKSDGTLEREELETEISQTEFESFWNCPQIGSIEKTRYEIEFERATAEVDEYDGKLFGLCTAEFEYDPEEIDPAYIYQYKDMLVEDDDDPCIDVTEFKCFKNRNLASTRSLDNVFANFRKEGMEMLKKAEEKEKLRLENMTAEEIEAEEQRELNSIENKLESWQGRE